MRLTICCAYSAVSSHLQVLERFVRCVDGQSCKRLGLPIDASDGIFNNQAIEWEIGTTYTPDAKTTTYTFRPIPKLKPPLSIPSGSEAF